MEPNTPNPSQTQDGWSRPKPDVLTKPTWWPAALALGVTLFCWGLVTSFVIIIAGVIVTVASLAGWIGEIRDEHKQH